MRRLLHGRPITVRITAGFLCAMAVLLLATSVFIYERMEYALDRSIADVPSTQPAEIAARRTHRDESLRELFLQLAFAYVGTLVVAGFVGYRTARAALGPVERMREQALSSGVEAGFRLPVPATGDELSRLATTLNELLARLQEAAERERRLLADASHELRTPLARLQMRADLALSRERSPDDLRATLRDVQQETGRLVRLANDLLLLARAAGGQLPLRPDEIALRQLAAAARARFAEAARAGGRSIVLAIPHDELLVADPDRISQALDNLLENALRHGSGTVTIRSESNGESVVLHVCDEGSGFPAAFVARAFDRFASASDGASAGDGAASGTGLGLAIVEAIVLSHGGSVGASNSPGGGADVWLALPTSDWARRGSTLQLRRT